jgi:hypothetical protein
MRSLWRHVGSWLRSRLRPRFRTEYVEEDAPEQPKARVLYVVMEDGEPWSAAMRCPCGCGELLHMNLLPDERPRWRLSIHDDGTSTLHPSVNRMKGCRAHFWFRNGRVYWCADQREHLWRGIGLLLGLKRTVR